MKRINIITKIALTLFALIATSCIEYYQVKTKINKDGSLIRTISVKGDSGSLFNGRLKVPNDTSWETSLTWEYKNKNDSSSEKRYTHTATKEFVNIEELNAFLEVEGDTSGMAEIKTELKKKFRWFYTFYSYTECFKKFFPFDHYPVDSFLTNSELSFFYDDDFTYSREKDSLIHFRNLAQMPLLSSEDSVRMEELEDDIMLKLRDWQAKNVVYEFLGLISMIKPEINLSNSDKDELSQAPNIVKMFSIAFEDDGDFLDSIANQFNLTEDSIKLLLPEQSKIFYFNIELCFDYINNDEIRNQIELPGLLLSCNADSIANNISYWNYNENRFFTKDYALITQSRTVNQWAFIVTGILIIILISLLVIGFIRK